MDLVKDLKQGNRRAIAKAISIVENDEKEARTLVKKIFKNSGQSLTIGI
ncbi:MAG: methylmalonyl Co-A mutase-associated GTPase MeaB, partial [Nitrosotalea sp.]